MHNPIAACTWIFGNRDPIDVASRLASLGLAGAEVFLDLRSYEPRELRRAFDRCGLRVFSMTPENVDIAHATPESREHAVTYYDRLSAFAAELGAPMITCHEHVGRTRPHDDAEREWSRLVESCRRIVGFAAARGLAVAFEPLNRTLVSAVRSAERANALIAA